MLEDVRYNRTLEGESYWHAQFELSRTEFARSVEVRRVNIEKVHYCGECPHYYVSFGVARVGEWPGLFSPDWIEVVW